MSDPPLIHLTRGTAGCQLAIRHAAVAIIVDALRASTTLLALLSQGVARILVVARVEDATALAQDYPGAILVGERGCERLPGFHLGNSPHEVLASPRMDGAVAIFTSSNGAQRLTACSGADRILVGAPGNATLLTTWMRQYALAQERHVVFVAAGKFPDETFLSPEDEATCTFLAWHLGFPIAPDSRATFARWERALIEQGLEGIFRSSRHAQRLLEIGYSDDVLFCARTDTLPAIPVVYGPVTLSGRMVGMEVRALNHNTMH
jgi:2-phosphosulfolactate phosphatase